MESLPDDRMNQHATRRQGLEALDALAGTLGIHTRYTDGLGRPVVVPADTLIRVSAALGAPIETVADAGDALRAVRAARTPGLVPPVLVAWDGVLPPIPVPDDVPVHAELVLDGGDVAPLERRGAELRSSRPLPLGYHRLSIEATGREGTCTVIAAPEQAWRRPGSGRSWGVGTQLAALRSARSRALGDLRDVESVCRWVGEQGGDLVMVLPLLPTYNIEPPEPSPYSPASRLFWSELILDLGDAHRPVGPVTTLDVRRADAEVRAALAGMPVPESALLDEELVRYARYRGAQIRLGRNWRDWPPPARAGRLDPDTVDPDEERFHLVAQTLARRQLADLGQRLDRTGVRIGMDLAVGVHPDGYDPWSRQSLFAERMSVGAPPDMGFPSGQDWGFPPVLPAASRREGHRYLAASIAHQATLSGVLRVDHVMAWTRLYWIPHGLRMSEGTYVSYPADELFAILTLESERARCEIVGENLGTVPPEIGEALPRHRIRGMYLAQFQAELDPGVAAPTAADMALVNTHDTPTFAGWLSGTDIDERLRCGLLSDSDVPRVREVRAVATQRLARRLNGSTDEPRALVAKVLRWLGESESPLVVPWFEDLWLETEGVNLPATRSSERPNWQRPMRKLLDEVFDDPGVLELAGLLHRARDAGREAPATPQESTG
jgi:4-alpha-glucanotransferase